MKTSAEGRELIEAFEGLMRTIPGRPGFYTTYYDSVGVLTIGYGHTNLGNIPPHITPGMVLSRDECDQALGNDLASFERDVERIMAGHPLRQYEFDALVSFDFNTGSLGRSSIDDKLKRGDTKGAMATLLQYDHAGGKKLAGLTRRRKAERLLFLGSVNQALELAGVHGRTGMADAGSWMLPKGAAKTVVA